MTALLWVLITLATVLADARWLRVGQREHYRAGRVMAIARLWSAVRKENTALLLIALVVQIVAIFVPGWAGTGIAAAGLVLIASFPIGLSPRPSSAPFAFTPRMRRVIVALVVLEVLSVLGLPVKAAALLPILSAPLTDLALLIVTPVERRLSRKFITTAQARLARVRPTVVAVTGSYGKTTTKWYAAQLIGGARTVAASPASFNNLLGLSRAVNDGLPDGTDVFIAEMGTYGPGEIRELCSIFPPDVSAIITIGEAHLERMKTRATIVAAKSEITERAGTVVLNIDVPELAALADRLEPVKRVLRVSSRPGSAADATVVNEQDHWTVCIRGERIASVPPPPTGHTANLAVAVGLALAVDVPPAAITRALGNLPTPAHRAEIAITEQGVTIIDDTYNANPDGAAQALAAARQLAGAGRIFTVTPGMIELGPRQAAANRDLGAAATAAENMSLAVTGHTNRLALLAGADPTRVSVYPNREAAARAVRAEARSGDVIVYENDLPDHYA